jgi:hypothetical protein
MCNKISLYKCFLQLLLIFFSFTIVYCGLESSEIAVTKPMALEAAMTSGPVTETSANFKL